VRGPQVVVFVRSINSSGLSVGAFQEIEYLTSLPPSTFAWDPCRWPSDGVLLSVEEYKPSGKILEDFESYVYFLSRSTETYTWSSLQPRLPSRFLSTNMHPVYSERSLISRTRSNRIAQLLQSCVVAVPVGVRTRTWSTSLFPNMSKETSERIS
jgi:hypothetical protein